MKNVSSSTRRYSPSRPVLVVALLSTLILLNGCASRHSQLQPRTGPFQFGRDTFAYPNNLIWDYEFDKDGKWSAHPHEPKPDYTHHCFVVIRSAKEFFNHARFDPDQPKLTEDEYRRLIGEIIGSAPRKVSPPGERVVIPGFAGLHDFSAEYQSLLKEECGGAWRSYFQKGHWRCIMPFTRRHQANEAEELKDTIRSGNPAAVHLMRFPQLSINHAMLLFDFVETPTEVRFSAYDPNDCEQPATLVYDRRSRTFYLGQNNYFYGGRVDVYQVYHRWDY